MIYTIPQSGQLSLGTLIVIKYPQLLLNCNRNKSSVSHCVMHGLLRLGEVYFDSRLETMFITELPHIFC